MNRVTAVLMVVILGASAGWGQTSLTVIRIEGSSSMASCTQRMADWYQSNHADASFRVNGVGDGKGIAAFGAGSAAPFCSPLPYPGLQSHLRP